MIKAGSLLYAIYICLLISLLTGALLLVFSFKKDFTLKLAIKSKLVNQCESCINYYLSDIENNNDVVDIFDDGLKCRFAKSKWGLFEKLTTKAFFKNDTIEKTILIGAASDNKNLALYLCDWGEELKISGNTSIKGDLNLPLKKIKTINILGNSQINKPKANGNIFSSNQNLPKLDYAIQNQNGKSIFFSEVRSQGYIFNDFKNSPLTIELEKGDKLTNLQLKGNIILNSKDTLYIDKYAKIQDVIIKAPKVVFERGFVGSLQVFADKEIIVEENVILQYPSSLAIISENNIDQKKIEINGDSQIYGALILDGKSFDEKENNEINLDEETLVVGDLYCNGKLELKGKITGSVYAHKLKLETKSGNYENVILNTVIDATSIPINYARLPILSNKNEQTYEVIKEL